jgi:hypothetical protein
MRYATQQFLTVKEFLKQPNCCNGKYNRERRCLLFQTQTLDLRGDTHKGQRREESVQSQVSQLVVSIQDRQRRDPRTTPRQDIRGSELIVKERL